ncbi:MAG: amidohydrolase family protein [Acidimicrobiia bacterium]
MAGRWEPGGLDRSTGQRRLTLTPKEALRRFWVDAVVHDPSYLRHVIDTFGLNRVMFGSDWPFPSGGRLQSSRVSGIWTRKRQTPP